jgi:hypothetical protein
VKRFHKLKVVGGVGAVAFMVTAVAFGSVSLAGVPGRSPAPHLTAGTAFSITSTFYTTPSGAYPAASCSGSPTLLYPGATRCAIFTVRNHLNVPITVQRIRTALDVRFPPPPAVCAGSYLILPNFSGAVRVGSSGSATSPGVPVMLRDSGSNQDVCQDVTYHFVYWGSARRTPTGTTITLRSTPNPSTVGSPVDLEAAVTCSAGSGTVNGTVSFYLGTPGGVHTLIGTRGLIAIGRANLIASWLPAGTDAIYAVYRGPSCPGSTSGTIVEVIVSWNRGSHKGQRPPWASSGVHRSDKG